MNAFNSRKTEEKGLLVSRPQRGLHTRNDSVSSSAAVGSRSCEPLPPRISEVANCCVCSRYGKQNPPLSSLPRAAGFLRLIGHRLMTLHASARPQR